MRFFAAIVLFFAFILWQMPATLLDRALERQSGGRLRLAGAHGTVWQGRAHLMVMDKQDDRWQAWTEVAWRQDWMALPQGGLEWQLTVQGQPLAKVGIGIGGIHLAGLHLRGPARFFLQQIPNVLGHAVWRGDMAFDAEQWSCTWQLHCSGSATLDWFNAASGLLEGRVLGDYRIELTGQGQEIGLHWSTPKGSIRIEGEGRWNGRGPPSFAGSIRGDMALLQFLPSIASRWVRASTEPGVWLISVP